MNPMGTPTRTTAKAIRLTEPAPAGVVPRVAFNAGVLSHSSSQRSRLAASVVGVKVVAAATVVADVGGTVVAAADVAGAGSSVPQASVASPSTTSAATSRCRVATGWRRTR